MTPTRPVVADRSSLKTRLDEARRRTDEMFALLTPAGLYERPIAERHRLVFYLGHVDAFDWNLFAPAWGLERFDARLDKLFAFGIDPVGGGLPNEPASDWPSREAVLDYDARVRERVDRALLEGPELEDPRLFETAIEHRLMHAETLAYLIHQLPYAHKIAPAERPAVPRPKVEARRVAIPAGRATLGRPREDDGFGWDNEYGRLEVEVPAFTIDALDVTNGAFLEFVKSGGYDDAQVWDEADRAWREAAGPRHPLFWQPADGGFRYRGMFGLEPLPLEAPVMVSLAEARAFARWAGAALPTEPQFHRAAYGTTSGHERAFPWGDEAPGPHHGNFDFARWDPVPAGSHPAGNSALGVADLVGNGWEWTSTVFGPFPGFEPYPFYPGYSADFFDGKHFVMKGGSPRTAAVMLRRPFRNWFQPHYPYVYATFRLVHP